MRKNKSKKLVLAVLAGLLFAMSVGGAHVTSWAGAQGANSSDSHLSTLDISPGDLTPAFSPDVFTYTSTVDAGVTQVSVQAVPRAAGGTIASVTGAKGLQQGKNVIEVTCSAPDNSYSVYKIELTVGSAGAQTEPESSANVEDTPQEGGTDDAPQGEGAQDTEPAADGSDKNSDKNSDKGAKKGGAKASSAAAAFMGPIASDGTVTLNGAAYRLSSNFTYGATTQDIPSAFGQGSVQIDGASYSTLYSESCGIHLVYMENTDGNGSTGFYYYDEKQNAVERFKYAGTDDDFVVFISSARDEVPAGYQDASLELPSGKEVMAYQNLASEQMQDFYLVYGIHSDGKDGWYLFDHAQGTHMRYVQMPGSEAAGDAEGEDPDEEEIEPTVSMKKYNKLYGEYTKLKKKMITTVSVLVIGLALLIIVFTAFLMRGKDAEADRGTERKKLKKDKKQREPVSKISLEAGRAAGVNKAAKGESKKITRSFEQEEAPKRKKEEEQVTSPEEIRMQLRREEERIQPNRNPVKKEAVATDDSVRLAAEKMRKSMQYTPPKGQKIENDPMDEWEVEAPSRKSRKKKRSQSNNEDIEVMDLNDF